MKKEVKTIIGIVVGMIALIVVALFVHKACTTDDNLGNSGEETLSVSETVKDNGQSGNEETTTAQDNKKPSNDEDKTIEAETVLQIEKGEQEVGTQVVENSTTKTIYEEPQTTIQATTREETQATTHEETQATTQATTTAQTQKPTCDQVQSSDIVALGATYYDASTEKILTAGEAMPTPEAGDVYTYGDYTYTYYMIERIPGKPVGIPQDYPGDGWKVSVRDKAKTKYGTVLSKIAGVSIVRLYYTYEGCTKMTEAPAIPESVTELMNTYENCTSLTKAPAMPSGLTNMFYTFYNCSSLKTAPTIGSNVESLAWTFYNCTSLTGNIIVNTNSDVCISWECCFNGVNFTIQNITFSGNADMITLLRHTGKK